MYLPRHFEQTDPAAVRTLISSHPLATLVTLGSEGLDANLVPFLLVEEASKIYLRGHVARANPAWRCTRDGSEALAVFRGPDAYVSPSWYPSKTETRKVVPTWAYVAVHARGVLCIKDEGLWVRQLVEALTMQHEAGRTPPWAVADAPADYMDAMVKAVVGIEIEVSHLQGKWKLCQDDGPRDCAGVAAGLRNGGAKIPVTMADLIERGT
ncbi:FMN-binding negative transcriptional regulator [Thiomonas sp. FB-Cd]|uniref:FMN-binding negative transcriptional regulator n=1 Tax=Thiomonas sp. FB-Cd TaxID=1158292 RepID=UPI0004DF0831|nr:FMN-binding negative transcriptional regulator [Thiomonas sp. FB-Cd]